MSLSTDEITALKEVVKSWKAKGKPDVVENAPKAYVYEYKNFVARPVRELTPAEVADWEKRCDEVLG